MESPEPKDEGPRPGSPQPELPTHSPDGVDLTLIRWMLSLTLAERLQVVQDHANSILRLRASIRR